MVYRSPVRERPRKVVWYVPQTYDEARGVWIKGEPERLKVYTGDRKALRLA